MAGFDPEVFGGAPAGASGVDEAIFGKTKPKAAVDTFRVDPTDGMSTLEKLLAGMGKAGYDVARGAGQWVGAVDRKDVAEARARDKALMATGAGKTGDILGNVAMALPTAFIPGANTITGGAAVGSVLGALQPSTSTGETALNLGLGSVAGAALPMLQRGWQVGKAAMRPFYDAGQELILGSALNKAAGGRASEVAARLAEASKPAVGPFQPGMEKTVLGEFVPGSIPTVGQASGNSGIAAMERAATQTQPHMQVAMAERLAEQNAARVNQLQSMAGADGQRAFFAADRSAVADQMYGAARRIGVDPAKLTPEALQNIAQFSARIPDAVLNEAKLLAKINGKEMTDATSVEGMHWVKMAIDSKIAESAGNSTLKAAYTGLQNDLISGMAKLSPSYDAARQTFAAMSKPINAMDTVQAILDKSVNKLTGNLQPNAFANALADKTAQSATGFRGATLANTLDNGQSNMLQSILADVQRSTAASKSPFAGSDTVQKLAYSGLMDSVGVPTFLRQASGGLLGNASNAVSAGGGLLGRIADSAYGRANKEMAAKLAEVMIDPAKAAALMRNASPAERSAIMEALGMSGQGLLLGAPQAVNALQQ